MPMPPPSVYDEQEGWEDGGGGPAAAVPPDVAESMRQFIQTLTTPESELEQQIAEEVARWASRHEPPPAAPAAAQPASRCVRSGGSRSSSPGSSAGAGSGAGARRASDDAASVASSSSGQSSEEGTSAAWRLCAWLQHGGWPVQHCASIRTGSSAGGGGGGGGWLSCSGHEFLLLHPAHARGRASAAGAGPRTPSSSSSDGGGCDAAGAGGGAGLAPVVVDPEFSTQFALAAPTPRFAVLLSLLPRVFVGSHRRLQQLVGWVCREMQFSFAAGGGGLPPWRSLDRVLDKWRLRREGADAGNAAAAPPLPPPQLQLAWGERLAQVPAEQLGGKGAPRPSPAACAFSALQQQQMRQLLGLDSPQCSTPAAELADRALGAAASGRATAARHSGASP